ncbi:MAG: hypothetical protein AB7F35_31440, partial [Acetobacteraceae bacterium]
GADSFLRFLHVRGVEPGGIHRLAKGAQDGAPGEQRGGRRQEQAHAAAQHLRPQSCIAEGEGGTQADEYERAAQACRKQELKGQRSTFDVHLGTHPRW